MICLMGPTASGKTELAGRLQERFPLGLVSVDAAQVYRGLDIGTGKPTRDLLARAPHWLLDVCGPEEAYSAARFCADAEQAIETILEQRKIPMLVGGSMFYFRAFEFGLSALPAADAGVRQRLLAEAELNGWGGLHARLGAHDPEAARRIQPHDRQRLQRALELWELTGETPSALRQRPATVRPYRWLHVAIAPTERAVLHARIAARFGDMLKAGLIPETQGLWEATEHYPEVPARRIVGYRQVGEYLSGAIHYNEMVVRALAATRQLAKRQWTWLRAYPDLHWFDSEDKQLTEKVADFIRQNLRAERTMR